MIILMLFYSQMCLFPLETDEGRRRYTLPPRSFVVVCVVLFLEVIGVLATRRVNGKISDTESKNRR
jgi:hypothetical protein